VAAGGLPRPEPRAFVVGPAVPLRRGETRAVFAPVDRPVRAVITPSPAARPVAVVDSRTPDATANIVAVVGQARIRDALWVRIRVPGLPNDRFGWVPRAALGGFGFVHTHLVIDRRRLTATLLNDGRRLFAAPVAVGRPDWPTPSGTFVIVDRLTRFTDPMYGPIAFGTSARSAVLTDWPGGGVVGIHGTDAPELVPGRVSHGCIRMRNRDIVRLARLMPVGTPVTVK
jgi:L,D-transpeptidase catalytic domain